MQKPRDFPDYDQVCNKINAFRFERTVIKLKETLFSAHSADFRLVHKCKTDRYLHLISLVLQILLNFAGQRRHQPLHIASRCRNCTFPVHLSNAYSMRLLLVVDSLSLAFYTPPFRVNRVAN